MNWKKLFKITGVLILLISSLSRAQNYKVYYQMNYKTDSLVSNFTKKNMVLVVNEDKSKFYSQEQFVNDSLVIDKEKTGSKAQKKYDYDFMVIKENNIKKLYKFTALHRDFYQTSENMPVFNWKITNETKKIENYTCQKATLDYSGRLWEAWFTIDISLLEGPYIFNGLPGLILYMRDSKNNYEFSFTGLKKDTTTNIDFFSVKPLEVNKKQLDKVFLDYYNDPYREMKSGNIKTRWQDENGKEFVPDYKVLTIDEQKNIKQNNNPIILSEAIKYP